MWVGKESLPLVLVIEMSSGQAPGCGRSLHEDGEHAGADQPPPAFNKAPGQHGAEAFWCF